MEAAPTTPKNVENGGGRHDSAAWRRRADGLGFPATLINFLNGMIGPGTLSLPLVYKQAGLWAAPIMVFLFGFLNNYCMLQLVHCSQHLTQRIDNTAALDYGGVAYAACAQNPWPLVPRLKHHARTAVNTAIVGLQMGICSVFIVFMAVNLSAWARETCGLEWTTVQWVLALLPALILLNFTRTLRLLSYISVAKNLLFVLAVVAIVQYLLFRAPHVPLSSLPPITDLSKLAIAGGSALYAFEGQAMVLPLENKMRAPSRMVGPFGVLSLGMGIVSCVYAGVGVCGYVTYGEQVQGSLSLNLPHQPIFAAAQLFLVLVIFFGYPLQQYVIVDMVWPGIERRLLEKKSISTRLLLPMELGFRALLVVIATAIAVLVPDLEDIIPLVGITSGMLLALVFPSTLDTLTFVPVMLENGTPRWRVYQRLVQNGLLSLIGLAGLAIGLWANVQNLTGAGSQG